MACAVEVAKTLNQDQVCVVLCPDNIRNYMTKFIVDNWMEARGFSESENIFHHSWWNEKISDVIDKAMRSKQIWMSLNSSSQDVLEKLKSSDVDQIPVVDDDGNLAGIATTSYLMNKMLDLSMNMSDGICKNLFKKFVKINGSSSLGRLSRVLEKESFVVVQFDEVENGDATSDEGLISWITTKLTISSRHGNEHLCKYFIVTQKDLLMILPAHVKNGY